MFLLGMLVAFATIVCQSNVSSQTDEQLLSSLGNIYSSSGTSNGKYFSSNGKAMFEQVSMLDSIALAKVDAISEARDQLKFLAIQTLLADLPPKFQAAGDLLAIIQSERSFFHQTISSGQSYLESVSQDIRQKVSEFESSEQTDQDRENVRGEIENIVRGKTTERNELANAWVTDFNRLKELAEANSPTPKQIKAWQVYGTVKVLVKRLKFQTTPGRFLGPVSDVLGIVISGFGLADAIENSNTKGIVKSVVGIVGGLVGLAAFGLAMPGLGAIAGVAFFIIPMIIEALWPSNLAIETANKLSEISRKDMEGHLTQLIKFSASGKKSFGWMYMANTGVMIKRGIQPDTQMKFFHPSCENPGASPCNPKKRSYEGKKYFMLGEERSSTDSRPEFALEMPFDFIGAPTEANFCGNTITINTTPFRQYLQSLVRKYKNIARNVGYFHRNIQIDTQVVPNYNDVNFGEWQRSKRSFIHSKIKRKLKKLRKQHDQQTECEPESDRITIDELDHIDPETGRITINTGAGKDVLSINSMIGEVASSKEDFIVSDLGDDGNLLSLGVALGIGRERGNLLVGVIFDNTGGNGKICYLKEDFETRRCVGHVKKVTVFKGSRLHDTVIMGADGPYVVIQNFGANEYIIDVDDIKRKQDSGEMRFEIMDTSGNRPIIKIQSSTRTPWYRHPEDGYFMVKPDGIDIRIDITGMVTEPDLYLVPTDGNEQCVYPQQF